MWCSANGFGSADHDSIGDDPAAVYFSWRSAFCRGYLEAMGRPAGKEDVFALLLDVERCSLRFLHPFNVAIEGTGAPPLRLPTLHGWWFDATHALDGKERAADDITALIHAKQNGGDLGQKYKECLDVADRALTERALAEEIVRKGFHHCDAVMAVCEKHRPAVSREPTGDSAGKTAKQIAGLVLANLGKIHELSPGFQQWYQDQVAKGDAGIAEALTVIVADGFNVLGLQFIEDDLRAEIARECTAAGFSNALLENVAKLSK